VCTGVAGGPVGQTFGPQGRAARARRDQGRRHRPMRLILSGRSAQAQGSARPRVSAPFDPRAGGVGHRLARNLSTRRVKRFPGPGSSPVPTPGSVFLPHSGQSKQVHRRTHSPLTAPAILTGGRGDGVPLCAPERPCGSSSKVLPPLELSPPNGGQIRGFSASDRHHRCRQTPPKRHPVDPSPSAADGLDAGLDVSRRVVF